MGFAGLSYVGVLIAAVVSFAFGAVWYGALAKPWMAALGTTKEAIDKGGGQTPVVLALTFGAELLMAYVLAGVIGHLGAERVTLMNGIVSGALVWLGFVLTTLTVNHRYGMQTWSLTVIDGGHWLGVLVIQGAIIGWWGI
jgi:hypothetical protein